LFITTPNTPSIQLSAGNQINPSLSTPGGVTGSFFIAIGTSPGTSNTLSWSNVANNIWYTIPGWSRNTNYYVSTYLSNTTNGRKSLAISNTTAYGLPNNPTVTLSITSTTNWTITWTHNSSTVTTPTSYAWYLHRASDHAIITSNTSVGSTTFSVTGNTAILYSDMYYAVVESFYAGSSATTTSATAVVPSLAAPVLTNFTSLPLRNTETVQANWGAVTNATGYRILINDTVIEDVATTSYSIRITDYTNSVKTFKVRSKDGSHFGGISTGLQFFYNKTPVNAWTNVTFTNAAIYLLRAIAGGGGGAASAQDGDVFSTGAIGGAGGMTTVTTNSARTTFDYLIGAGGSASSGAHPGPGGNGRSFSGSVYSGGGGGYTLIHYPGAAYIPVWAGGGGGCGGGTANLAITGGQTGKKVAGIHASGGSGGSGNSDNGGAFGGASTSTTSSMKVNNGTINVYAHEGQPGGLSGPGIIINSAANVVNIGGTFTSTGSPSLMTSDYGERISYPADVASFRPTSGNANAGGTGARIYWFAGACGGGGGAGYYGGSGGHAYIVATGNETAAADQYKSVAVGAGGGGGSGYAHTDYVTKFGSTTDYASGGSTGQGGSIFIVQRV
jgi:hypothetical protein